MAESPYSENGLDPGTSTDGGADSSVSADVDDTDDTDDTEAVLETARKRLGLAIEAERDFRSLALEDKKFLAGEQWPAHIKAERDNDQRPCITVNRLPQFTNQVVNDQKQNRPSLKVHAVDSGATEETAKTIQGLFRHIEYNSNAEVAYDQAVEDAAEGGFGYFRIRTDFASPDTFDQEIYIDAIENPFSVYFDPLSKKLDGSDASWAFIVDSLPKEDYKALYPDSELSTSQLDWVSVGNQAPDWIGADEVRVAEYLYKEFRNETIHLLSTGETVSEKDLGGRLAEAQAANLPVSVAKSRTAKVPHVCWVKTNGIEILQKTDWVGTSIPIIPVYGKRRLIEGKKILESVHRHAKDPQRMFNYMKSAEAEAIGLAPRAPFIGFEGQFEGHEQQWKTANRRNHAYLEVRPISNGQPAPLPQRQAVEPAVQAITQAGMMAADDLKATTGIYDSGMGAQSNEISGVAINSRAGQVQMSTFHFGDNLKHSMRHAGRILIEVLPKIYDTARTARIIHDDGTHEVVKLNQDTGKTGKDGKPLIYDLSVGRYDVTVDIGPSYASRRQEAADSMMEFTGRLPPDKAGAVVDLIARNQDWPGAQEIAERLKKLLPPPLQDDGKNQTPIPPQVQAQMQQQQMMIQQLTEHLNETTKVIETKKMDLEHRERIEILKLQTNAEIEMAKLGSKEDMALLSAKLTEMEHRLSLLNMNAPIEAPDDFNPQQADGGNYAGVGHVGSGPTGGPGSSQSPGSPMEGP